MNYSATTLVLQFISVCALAQVEVVDEKVKSAYGHYESAFNDIQNGLENINHCYDVGTIEEIQDYARYAEDDISNARSLIGYAEIETEDAAREAEEINCTTAEEKAVAAKDYFYSAMNRLEDALSELEQAMVEDDLDNLAGYLSDAEDNMGNANRDLNYAVAELNNVLNSLVNCKVDPTNYSKSIVSCVELLEFIEENGNQKTKLSNYTLNSSWLYSVTAFTYDYKIFVIAAIKENEYTVTTKSYIFCGIPSANWSNFRYATYGDSDSYGERFHKYILDFKCNCE